MKLRNFLKKTLLGIFYFIFFMYISLIVNVKTEKFEVVTADYNVPAIQSNSYIYLSDIDYVANKSSSGWGTIKKDQDANGNKIKVRVEGALYSFDKGMWAHAKSTLVYDLTNYNYDYFTAYVGINATASGQGSVKFYIYTSNDGENWDLQTSENPQISTVSQNAEFVKINIKGVKFLKLYADPNGANGNDHAVYADAKLIKEGYDDNVVKSVEEFDEILKTQYANATLSDKDYELTLLQRNFVNKAGRFALKVFLTDENNATRNKAAFDWLFNDVDNLRLYTLGGTPDGGSYANSLTQLARLYENYKDDFKITEKTRYGTVLGDLYKKMAITLSLTHSQRVALWMQPSAIENQSDAVTRYQIFKDLHKNNKFVVTENIDITKWFENYTVEEMRFVLNNIIDDEEILWLNEYTQSFIDKYPNQAWKYLTPHPYMAYVWPNYGREEFHDPDRKDYWDEKFNGIFSKYNVTYRPGLYKVWMNIRNEFGTGAVCGGISKTGSNIRTSHGIPAAVIGQPGHAAIIYYSQDDQGNGYWNIDNDVSGWTLSEKSERMLLGWGNASYARGSYQVVYMALAQEVLNDYDNFEKSEETIMIAETYKDDLVKQEQLYRQAIEIQPINIDAWYGLINNYIANPNKTEDDFYALAEELAENLKYFPLPMYHLTNLIKPKLVSIQNSYKFALLQTRILTESSKTPNNTADNYYVYQPSLTRTEANFLLGKIDNTIATFSFDGENAGKIVLSSRFDGNGVRWDYSLDGKKTWKTVSFAAEEEHKLQLSKEELAKITAENDIYIHIVGVNYEEKNLYQIDITKGVVSSNLFNNDLENRIVGIDLTYEWRMSDKDAWISYKTTSPDLTGNKTVEIRVGATKTQLPSDSVKYSFTNDNQPDTRKYIPVSHLSIHSVSTEATSHAGQATNAIDANVNTRWHSAWNGTDDKRFITIKLDKPVYLSALEFVPAGGGNGKIYDGTIWGSKDGENWEILATAKNLKYTSNDDWANNIKNFEIENPKEVQYVKIVADRTNGNWFTARMFNLYQDMTKNPHPTAGIAYSTTESTNGVVVARLVNKSADIKITNNDGKDTYVFTENGEFTFEFEDTKGNIGHATAKVTWIDKDSPTADVDYELNDEKKLVISLENINEDVYLLDKNNNKINFIEVKDGKVSNISYLNSLGNVYKVVEMNEKGVITKIRYANTTGSVSNVSVYETILENGVVTDENYYDVYGNTISVTNEEKEILKRLQQPLANPLEYTFDDSGDYEFKLLDKASNIAYKSIKVDYTRNNTIIASDITYDITKLTNNNVVATINPYIIDINGKTVSVEVVNNNKDKKYTFIKNGEFTFEYKDTSDVDSLDVKEHTARVNWIDKVVPTATIKYSTTEATSGNVIATLTNESEQITIINNGTSRDYTFTKNGEFTFEFIDIAGNIGYTTAKVDWIDKIAPTGTITYNITNLTNKDVTATIQIDKDAYIANNNGSNTYTFTKNGEFDFMIVDKANNVSYVKAKVNWIDKVAPDASITYNITNSTKNPVTVTVSSNEKIFIINNNGSNTYTFTKNGSFDFIYQDVLGNMGKITAKVDWIQENISPVKPSTPNIQNPVEKPNDSNENNSDINNYPLNQNYKYSTDNIILNITDDFGFKVNLEVNKLTLTNDMKKYFDPNSEYFELYLKNDNNEKINITNKAKITIILDKNKEYLGIYEVLENDIRPLNYNRLNNNQIEIETENLSKYIISYKQIEKETEKEEIKNEETISKKNNNFVWIIMIIIILSLGLLIRRKNKKIA